MLTRKNIQNFNPSGVIGRPAPLKIQKIESQKALNHVLTF